jgi:hypothetical protein
MFDMVGAGLLGWVAITLVIYAGIWLYLWISEWFHSGKNLDNAQYRTILGLRQFS